MRLALALGLPREQAALVEVGAHLHDVGKLRIPVELLNLPRKLEDEEREQMESHSMLGWEIVNQAGYDQVILDIVRHHHEHWDGNGYPDRLKENEIPVGAQIVGICDVYEALTSKRSYREAYSHNFARAFIQKGKTMLFEPKLVDLFLATVKP